MLSAVLFSSRLAGQAARDGVTKHGCNHFRNIIKTWRISETLPATWEKCGRKPNAFAKLVDGQQFCVRYRNPHNFFVAGTLCDSLSVLEAFKKTMIIGEILSYYLARELGLDLTLPCVTLARTDPLKKWKLNGNFTDWKPKKVVALIEWLPSFVGYVFSITIR